MTKKLDVVSSSLPQSIPVLRTHDDLMSVPVHPSVKQLGDYRGLSSGRKPIRPKETICDNTVDQAVAYHWLYKETVNYLESLERGVASGEGLDEALNFARWLLFSGMDKVLKPYNNSGALKVDSVFLRWKADNLRQMVQELYRTGKAAPEARSAQLDSINHKLDLIAGRLAQIEPEVTYAKRAAA